MLYWRGRFLEQPVTDFCSVIKTNSTGPVGESTELLLRNLTTNDTHKQFPSTTADVQKPASCGMIGISQLCFYITLNFLYFYNLLVLSGVILSV